MIRKLYEEDFEQALQLVRTIFLIFEAPDYSEQGVQSFFDYISLPHIKSIAADGSLELWGYYEDGILVGVAATRNKSHISLLFVESDCQGSGIGSALCEVALEGCKTATVHAAPYAVGFYQKLGFTATNVEQVIDGIRFTPMHRGQILETERLYLRPMTKTDYPDLCEILQDKEVMYAYEHAFSDEECAVWLAKQESRYAELGLGLWAVLRKEDDEFVGQCGLTLQPCDGEELLEIGYLFKKQYWHMGYALEAAAGCKQYAFHVLKAEKVYSIIRENNLPSIAVAEKNEMHLCGKTIKHYYGMDMPHLIYVAERE